MTDRDERLKHLAEMASNEQDLQKFMALVREINLILEEKTRTPRETADSVQAVGIILKRPTTGIYLPGWSACVEVAYVRC